MNQANDDDGIIDLRALASTPPPRGAFAMPSPFASEPPPAFTLDANDADSARASSRGSKTKTIAIVVASAAFLALGCVGVGFAFRGPKAAPPRAAVMAPPAAPSVAAPPPVVAEPAPAAAPAPSAAEEPPAAEAPSTKKSKNGKARAAGAKSTKAGGAVTKAPVTKASDPCNCHGDFQCNIRCAANK